MTDFFKELSKLLGEHLLDEENNENKSYYHSVDKVWKDDELVSSHEREYKNGKCTKSEDFEDAAKLTDKKEECTSDSQCSCNESISVTTEILQKRLKSYIDANDALAKELAEFKKTNMKLQEENTILKCKLDKIKNMF